MVEEAVDKAIVTDEEVIICWELMFPEGSSKRR